MSEEDFKKAQEETDKEFAALRQKYQRILASDSLRGLDGWNSPPAQIPRAGEIAMGIYHDPFRNTH